MGLFEERLLGLPTPQSNRNYFLDVSQVDFAFSLYLTLLCGFTGTSNLLTCRRGGTLPTMTSKVDNGDPIVSVCPYRHFLYA